MKIKCKFCNNIFRGRKERKFCSVLCYNKWAKGKKFGKNKPKNRKISICLICEKKFEHWAGRNAKYCSKECWSKRNPKVLHQCSFCGKEFWDYKSNNRYYCSERCKNLHKRELLKGKNSHFWRGNKTKLNILERTRAKYLEWRTKVFKRDDYTCQKCGVKSGCGYKIYLHAHHKKSFSRFPELRFDINNGITLCKDCHLLEHFHKF